MEKRFPLRDDENAQQEMYEYFEAKDLAEANEREKEYEWLINLENITDGTR